MFNTRHTTFKTKSLQFEIDIGDRELEKYWELFLDRNILLNKDLQL